MNDTNTLNSGESAENPAKVQSAPFVIHAQYIKDLSFENPGAPESLKAQSKAPEMNIDINLEVRGIEDDAISDLYEIDMILKVHAQSEDKALFLCELVYSAAVSVTGVPENQRHPMLLIQGPHFMFPYARQVITETVQKGGYSALMLNPIDFRDLYLQRFGKDQAAPEDDKSAA